MGNRRPYYIDEVEDHWTRERKIAHLLPLAKSVADRWKLRRDTISLDNDDLYSEACQAVIQAVDEFEPERQVSLVAFAKKKIRWAIQETVRTNSHAPRSMVSKGKIVSWTFFSQEVGKGGAQMGDIVAEVFADERSTDMIDMIAYQQDKERMYSYLESLPEIHQEIVSYYIKNNCTQREVAEHVGLSESRVLQILNQSSTEMRKMMERELRTAKIEMGRRGISLD